MRAKDIVVGESYRHKGTPTYCWAKVTEVLPPKTGWNTLNKIIVRCEWSVEKDSKFVIYKYFAPKDLLNNK